MRKMIQTFWLKEAVNQILHVARASEQLHGIPAFSSCSLRHEIQNVEAQERVLQDQVCQLTISDFLQQNLS